MLNCLINACLKVCSYYKVLLNNTYDNTQKQTNKATPLYHVQYKYSLYSSKKRENT